MSGKKTADHCMPRAAEIPLSEQNSLIDCALQYLTPRMQKIDLPKQKNDVMHYCQLMLHAEKNQVFAMFFLDQQHRLLAFEKLFEGGIDRVSLSLRLIAQRILQHQAAAVILVNSHPCEALKRTREDAQVIEQCQALLTLLGVEMLEHFIVAKNYGYAFMKEKIRLGK